MPSTFPWTCRLFLFDLDGTLIDSRADITKSVNLALRGLQLPEISPELVREFVGNGVHKLMQRTLREVLRHEPTDARLRDAIELYVREYGAHMLDSTTLYPGAERMLDSLPWGIFGVITNKPEDFSRRILDGLGVGKRFRIVLGGDSMAQRKPDPAPLLEAMRRCAVGPSDTVMIGDSAVDICAGRAAGALTCGVATGFRTRDELEAAGCDLIVDDLSALPSYFREPR
jgi:phosphoglycolate phosphatase